MTRNTVIVTFLQNFFTFFRSDSLVWIWEGEKNSSVRKTEEKNK
jgi:hypothetical protein